jgi:hypothetical protein
MNPHWPVYVVSKGRWESRKTVKALSKIGVPFRVVVEPTEFIRYRMVIEHDKLLTLPFADLGQGSIPARNWIWEHAIAEGHEFHWVLDDNISEFLRLHHNLKVAVGDGTIFCAAEDFVARFENVGQAGFNYYMFAPRKYMVPPLYLNTRIYSCILLRNDLPFRWRGRYNEDTDLSLRILKSGMCTVLFNAFLCHKQSTMSMRGGNTDKLYRQGGGFDGRLEMAKSLQQQHPDVVKITRKWGRWQHHVDYSGFRANKLRLKPGVALPSGADDFGMSLQQRTEDGEWLPKE